MSGKVFKYLSLAFKLINKLCISIFDDIKKRYHERSQVTSVTLLIADLKCLVVLADIFVDRRSKTISDYRSFGFRCQQVAADKSAGSSVAVIERVDISEQIMENRYSEIYAYAVVVEKI